MPPALFYAPISNLMKPDKVSVSNLDKAYDNFMKPCRKLRQLDEGPVYLFEAPLLLELAPADQRHKSH